MTEGTFKGVGDIKIFTREWQPAGKPHGVVVISHGLNAHSGLYEWAGGQFTSKGLAVYALDHATLGASPIDNALTLARALPAGTDVHLLTHSRGGLVAEVLARLEGLPLPARKPQASWQQSSAP